MSDVAPKLIEQFVRESLKLVGECSDLLRRIQNHPELAAELKIFSNKIDRIMGAARMFAIDDGIESVVHLIAENTAIAKKISLQGLRSENHPELYAATITFLGNLTSTTEKLLQKMGTPFAQLPEALKKSSNEEMARLTELDRQQVGEQVTPEETLLQIDIDELFKDDSILKSKSKN